VSQACAHVTFHLGAHPRFQLPPCHTKHVHKGKGLEQTSMYRIYFRNCSHDRNYLHPLLAVVFKCKSTDFCRLFGQLISSKTLLHGLGIVCLNLELVEHSRTKVARQQDPEVMNLNKLNVIAARGKESTKRIYYLTPIIKLPQPDTRYTFFTLNGCSR
jgi:hypothetical protein